MRVISHYRTPPLPEVPVALSRDGTHGPVVHAVNLAAQARGILAGARVVDVQAIHPDLHIERADIDGDALLLQRLVFWSRRWGPWTVRDVDDGLILDVTGCAHLFGGEAALLHDITQRFKMQGLTVRLAIAPTRGAAQALARFAPAASMCDQGGVQQALASLPVSALRLDQATARLLDRLGLKTIGALMRVPRASVMRRFAKLEVGRNPLILLDRALGRAADPLDAPPDATVYMARSRLPDPVIDPAPHLPGLIGDLCQSLAAEERGARALRFTIYRIDGEYRTIRFAIGRASREARHIARLFEGKLDRIDPGFGFDLLTLEAVQTEPLSLHQDRLDGARDASADVAALIDRLTARLGQDKVAWTTRSPSHMPERVQGWVPALARAPQEGETLTVSKERPVRLLSPPEEVRVIYAVPEGPPSQFRWRRVLYKTVRQAGPERIAPEWWRDRPGSRLRDYYKVEVQDGRRFWLYREGVLGDGRGDTPRWFLHGFFI